MPTLKIVVPLVVVDEKAGQAIVTSLEAQFPNSTLSAFYESRQDTSSKKEAQRDAALQAATQGFLSVLSDPGVKVAVASAVAVSVAAQVAADAAALKVATQAGVAPTKLA